jgi:two-component system, NtrC family, response regulator HydG
MPKGWGRTAKNARSGARAAFGTGCAVFADVSHTPVLKLAKPVSLIQDAARGEVLLVDDDRHALRALKALLEGEGFRVRTAHGGRAALDELTEAPPDVLVTDLHMPEVDGLEVLRRAKAIDDDLPAIMMTALGEVDSAIAAMKAGALHYLQKPVRIEELSVLLGQALEHRRARREVKALRGRLGEKLRPANMVGESPAMQAVWKVVAQVAPTRASVLITGESGTGKGLVAQALHEQSPRQGAPFVKLHCAALAESLLESELFGHEKGAFTGAFSRREGRFKQADGGTLFLDEIGEISPAIQVKLLRFLQERTFERVGSNEAVKVDVRLLVATNRDLAHEVQKGRFREDLYYRLNVVTIEMPPLRLRGGDVLALAEHFLRRYAGENGKPIAGFDREAAARIAEYAWPGNVRELESAVERAVVLCEGPKVKVSDLPIVLRAPPAEALRVPGSTMAEIERHAILSTLEAVGGSTAKAARLLGLSVRTIQYRLREYGANDHAPAPRAEGG